MEALFRPAALLKALYFPRSFHVPSPFGVVDIQTWWLSVGLVLLTFITFGWATPARPQVPVVLAKELQDRHKRATEYFLHPRQVLNKGYQSFSDRVWGIDTRQGLKLVLPLRYLDELKSHPALSFTESISHDALIQYTGVGGLPDHITHIFKSKFNPSIATYVPVLHEIVKKELPLVFPSNESWTETNVYDKMMRIVGVISTRAFYSSPASEDEAWLDAAQSYVSGVLDYLQELKQWPKMMWPVVYLTLPGRANVVKRWRELRCHLAASLQAKRDTGRSDNPPSLFDHIVDGKDVKVDDLIQVQIALVVAGIHTTAAALTQFLYDLAVHPGSVAELRDEALEAYQADGGSFTKQSLSKLTKLDSWMKEIQRISSADLTTFQRMAVKPLRLKDGLYIPQKTKMEVATAAIHADDDFFDNAGRFDGLRFYRMRQNQEQASKHQYVSTGRSDLSWGYGRHACPGRFLADVEMKMILAEFLMHFDVRNPDGQPRHANLEFETNVMPDTSKSVLIKSVKPW